MDVLQICLGCHYERARQSNYDRHKICLNLVIIFNFFGKTNYNVYSHDVLVLLRVDK